MGDDLARGLGPEAKAEALRNQNQEALGLAADVRRGFLVGVDLPGDEEEVVADAVQDDAGKDHPHDFVGGRRQNRAVAGDPREHADARASTSRPGVRSRGA